MILEENGKEWFVAKDVAELLGYAKSRNTIGRHCIGALKRGLPKSIGCQEVTLIPERDLYRLVMKSKLPAAEKFEEWVVAEVLPSIRKTGMYVTAEKQMELLTNPRAVAEMLVRFADEQELRNQSSQKPIFRGQLFGKVSASRYPP